MNNIPKCSACGGEMEYWPCPNGPECPGCMYPTGSIKNYPYYKCKQCQKTRPIKEPPFSEDEIKQIREILNKCPK